METLTKQRHAAPYGSNRYVTPTNFKEINTQDHILRRSDFTNDEFACPKVSLTKEVFCRPEVSKFEGPKSRDFLRSRQYRTNICFGLDKDQRRTSNRDIGQGGNQFVRPAPIPTGRENHVGHYDPYWSEGTNRSSVYRDNFCVSQGTTESFVATSVEKKRRAGNAGSTHFKFGNDGNNFVTENAKNFRDIPDGVYNSFDSCPRSRILKEKDWKQGNGLKFPTPTTKEHYNPRPWQGPIRELVPGAAYHTSAHFSLGNSGAKPIPFYESEYRPCIPRIPLKIASPPPSGISRLSANDSEPLVGGKSRGRTLTKFDFERNRPTRVRPGTAALPSLVLGYYPRTDWWTRQRMSYMPFPKQALAQPHVDTPIWINPFDFLCRGKQSNKTETRTRFGTPPLKEGVYSSGKEAKERQKKDKTTHFQLGFHSKNGSSEYASKFDPSSCIRRRSPSDEPNRYVRPQVNFNYLTHPEPGLSSPLIYNSINFSDYRAMSPNSVTAARAFRRGISPRRVLPGIPMDCVAPSRRNPISQTAVDFVGRKYVPVY